MIGNCPNCGAWVAGDECEYCGTRFVETPGRGKEPVSYFSNEPVMLQTTSIGDNYMVFHVPNTDDCEVMYNGKRFIGIKEFNEYCKNNRINVKRLKKV